MSGNLFHRTGGLDRGSFSLAVRAFGSLPEVKGVLYGVKPAIIAVVLQGALLARQDGA